MRLPVALMFLSALLLTQQLSLGEALRIAAFNLHRLSPGKLNPHNANNIKGPLSQFICKQKWDIAFLQELTCADALADLVNSLNQTPNCVHNEIQYQSTHTVRLPEQGVYNREITAYIYRADKVTVLDSAIRQLTYPVGALATPAPIFFRPPFILRAQVTQAVPELQCMPEFFLIGLHARPTRVYSELNGLVDAYDLTRHDYGQENALILGDFNADGISFGEVDKLQNVLVRRQDFRWLIDDNTKTNTAQESRAYDRIVAAGHLMRQNAQNAQVPRWDPPPALSDHYPVSVDLRCPPPPQTMIQDSNLDRDVPSQRRQNPSQYLRRFHVKNQDVVGQ